MYKKINSIFIYIILISLPCIFPSCTAQNSSNTKNMINTTTVQHLDINKYMGTWYEIARFQHPFEKNLVGVTATYEIRKDGKISVLNQGYKYNFEGKHKTARGKAKIPNPTEPGKLKVSFFLFFYSDYFVLELDKDYQWAMIGSSSPDYFWILSRSPQMDDSIYQMLLENAKDRGYPVDLIYKVPQK